MAFKIAMKLLNLQISKDRTRPIGRSLLLLYRCIGLSGNLQKGHDRWFVLILVALWQDIYRLSTSTWSTRAGGTHAKDIPHSAHQLCNPNPPSPSYTGFCCNITAPICFVYRLDYACSFVLNTLWTNASSRGSRVRACIITLRDSRRRSEAFRQSY